ncbi:MAG: LytTR family transcriptional regulator [bacterium]|nr:LytTR family transcriptional regulator [bacterium]
MAVLTDKYPAVTSTSRRILMSLIMSSFVFAFLAIFRPFGISSDPNAVMLCAGYGLTCFSVMFVLNVVIIPLLPGFFNESNWLVWKEIVWVIINVSAIGLANALYSAWALDLDFTPKLVGTFQLYTVAVAFLPIILSVLTNHSRLRNKYERYSDDLSKEIIGHSANIQQFSISSASESVLLSTESFLYAKAADNYLEVVHMDGETLKREVIRKTLKSASEELGHFEHIFQVHRSYLVNLERVSRFSGNAQGLKLHFEETDSVVPVSRNLTNAMKERLAVRP